MKKVVAAAEEPNQIVNATPYINPINPKAQTLQEHQQKNETTRQGTAELLPMKKIGNWDEATEMRLGLASAISIVAVLLLLFFGVVQDGVVLVWF